MAWLMLALALTASFGWVDAAVAKTKITHLVVFGDSISDGRAYRILEAKFKGMNQSLNNSLLKFDPAYCQGPTCRFTNGPCWAEDLAKNNSWVLSDYAVGGSTSDNAVVQVPSYPGTNLQAPSAKEQLGQFFANASDPARNHTSTTLYVIFTGTNDVSYNSFASANTTVNTIGSMVTRIKASGGKYILVASLYDLSKTPGAYTNLLGALGPNLILSQFCSTFQAAMSTLASSQNIAFLSAYDFFAKITSNATAYGYNPAKVKESCLVQGSLLSSRSLCSNSDEYIYFDTVHPTRKTHNLMAQQARKLLASHYGI